MGHIQGTCPLISKKDSLGIPQEEVGPIALSTWEGTTCTSWLGLQAYLSWAPSYNSRLLQTKVALVAVRIQE